MSEWIDPGPSNEANFMSGLASLAVIGFVSITTEWISVGRRMVSPRRLDRVPTVGDRLVRRVDGKRFGVSYVASLPGGDMSFTLRADDGERASVDCDDLFPRLGKASPFVFLS